MLNRSQIKLGTSTAATNAILTVGSSSLIFAIYPSGTQGMVSVNTTTVSSTFMIQGMDGAAGAAANAPEALTVVGGTGATGFAQVGRGGAISLTGGMGGYTAGVSAKEGGPINIVGGIGASSLSTHNIDGGAGGILRFLGGIGGNSSGGGSGTDTGGVGGGIVITAGSGGDNKGGVGVAIAGDDGGAGGSVTINPGVGGDGFARGTTGNIILANLRGLVGIGTSTPLARLTVGGAPELGVTSSLLFLGSGAQIQGGSTSGTLVGANMPSSYGGDLLNFQVNSSSQFKVSFYNPIFGAMAETGAFVSRNSYIGEEFNTFRPNFTTDTTGATSTAGSRGAWGDGGGGWGVYASGTCTFSSVADAVNGIARMNVGAANSACMTMMDEALNNPRLITASASLPMVLMKIRPQYVSSTNFFYAGLGGDIDAITSSTPTGTIAFTNDWGRKGTSTWRGMVSNGGTISSSTCENQTISTSSFALLMIKMATSTSVEFLVDNNVSNGINFVSCGTLTTNIPGLPLTPQINYQLTTSTVAAAMDIDFIRVWQDDSFSDVPPPPVPVEQVEAMISREEAFKIQSSLAAYFDADDLNLATGTLVALDENTTGTPKVKPTGKPYDSRLRGVVVDDPPIILGSGSVQGVRVAIGGRAGVKVTTKNGVIRPGDPLTSSDALGVAMKATKAGWILGRAATAYDGEGEGLVTVEIEPGFAGGLVPVGAGGSEVGLAQISEIQKTENALDSQIFTDRLVAALEIITPKISVNELQVDGTASFGGTLTAQTIEAQEIRTPGLNYMSSTLLALGSSVEEIRNRLVAIESGLTPSSSTGSSTLALDIQEVLNRPDSLSVAGELTLKGGLKVNQIRSLDEAILIQSDAIFFGRPYLNSDSGGFAVVSKDERQVDVTFDREYVTEPVVNVTITLADNEQATSSEEAIFGGDVDYLITRKSVRGFRILLKRPAPVDITFSWTALAVKDAKTFTFRTAPVVAEPVLPPPELNASGTTADQVTSSSEAVSSSTPSTTSTSETAPPPDGTVDPGLTTPSDPGVIPDPTPPAPIDTPPPISSP